MATRKTTTKAKTKTTKRTTKTAATRSNKAAAQSEKVALVKREARITGKLLGWDIVFSVGLAILAAIFMSSRTVTINITHLTSDLLLSQDGTTFVTAYKPLMDLQLRWALVGILLLSAVVPLLYLTKLKTYYATALTKRRVIGARWISMAVSSALMVEIIALMCGINDLMTLKMMGALIGATCALGWLAERQNQSGRTPEWSAYTISIFTGVMPWVAIGVAKAGTLLYGSVRSPWYVYAACITTLLGFLLLAWNQFNQHRRYKAWTDYAIVERNYLLINMLTKSAFAVILIIGLMK